jgi:hypothetical protein
MKASKTYSEIACILLMLLSAGCAGQRPRVVLELFLVSPFDDRTLAYGLLIADISNDSSDPDTVARRLFAENCSAAILHSTSWRREGNGTLVLTYLAFSEDAGCRNIQPLRLSRSELLPPKTTDPEKPRPKEIRQQDVLAHGLRHITFLVRYSRDRRIAKTLSPGSLRFFQAMCAQLAGRYETASEFEDCSKIDGLR